MQDAFTSYYETPLVLDLIDLIQALGFRPWLAPYRPNGKALHVHGFLGAFERIASANTAMLRDLAATGVDLVGLDPSMTLTYRSEYAGALEGSPRAARAARAGMARPASRRQPGCRGTSTDYLLLPHCTERTNALAAVRDWSFGFRRVRPEADGPAVRLLRHGGHLGARGRAPPDVGAHLRAELGAARRRAGTTGRLLADGYSCRSQAKLIDGVRLLHPVQALLAAVRNPIAAGGQAEPTPPDADSAGLHQTPVDAEAAQMG